MIVLLSFQGIFLVLVFGTAVSGVLMILECFLASIWLNKHPKPKSDHDLSTKNQDQLNHAELDWTGCNGPVVCSMCGDELMLVHRRRPIYIR